MTGPTQNDFTSSNKPLALSPVTVYEKMYDDVLSTLNAGTERRSDWHTWQKGEGNISAVFTPSGYGQLHQHGEQFFQPLNNAVIRTLPFTEGSNIYTLPGGYYYLTKNTTMDPYRFLGITGEVHLCLNGHALGLKGPITLGKNDKLYLMDDAAGGGRLITRHNTDPLILKTQYPEQIFDSESVTVEGKKTTYGYRGDPFWSPIPQDLTAPLAYPVVGDMMTADSFQLVKTATIKGESGEIRTTSTTSSRLQRDHTHIEDNVEQTV